MRSVASSTCVPSIPARNGQLHSFHFQAEAAASRDIGSPGADNVVSSVLPTISEVQNEPVDPGTTASDIDLDALKTCEDADDPNQAVGNARTLPVDE